jgi:hypothetical protein
MILIKDSRLGDIKVGKEEKETEAAFYGRYFHGD